jgi:hypothetical protein
MVCSGSIVLLSSGTRSAFSLGESQCAAVDQDLLLLDVGPPVDENNASTCLEGGSTVRHYIQEMSTSCQGCHSKPRKGISLPTTVP